MELRLLLSLALALAFFCEVRSQGTVVDPDLRRLCNAQSTCRECIQASPSCTWCADQSFPSMSPRCYPTDDPEVTCASMPQNPMGGVTNQNMPNLGGITQISPATIDVSVRPGQPITFPLSVRPARNFPIDLYLLMDLSFSMNDDLNNLKRLGANLAASIVGISNNFTIGFGSFVDKRLAPYVNLREEIQNNPCFFRRSEFPNGCVPTYSYRHVVRLTSNQTRFNEQVQAQNISGNQDSPEGGFDGFLQSLVCTELIGWRGLSRKLLLYITDAGFHFANDGKLGGVILPNDGRCRVDMPTTPGAEVDYNDWDVYDYPSIGQIAELLRLNDIIPIFAAEANARPIYDALVRELGDGAFSGTLDSDSGNIVGLVRELYDTISQRILFDPQPIPGVSFNITPTNCPGVITADGTCTGVAIEQTATFDVSVSLTECNDQNSGRVIPVPIRVVGFGTFTVMLTAVCGCPCEDNPVSNNTICSGQGNLTCGVCECNEGRLGDMCQCDANGVGGTGLMCPLGPTEVECTRSDRGTCVCGECICRTNAQGEPEFYGPACECDDSRCGRVDGLLCSGRGTCSCSGCQCNVEPTTNMPYINGDANACECTPNTDCIDPRNNTAMCNGHGTCGCDGTCQCETPYSGTYCGTCSGSSECTENCDINQICAQCAIDVVQQYLDEGNLFFAPGILSRPGIPAGSTFNLSGDTFELRLPPTSQFCEAVTEANRCPNIVIINGSSTVEYDIDGIDSVRCELLSGGCTHRYYVAPDQSDTIDPNANPFLDLHVEFLRTCPEAVVGTAPWIIAIAIIIPLLVLGLLALLLLKVLLLIFDAVEVKRFEEELARTKYSKNLNPLYQPPIEEIDNPAYGK